ncbi:MAG: STAS domain-containing protein [Planctomycetota bacterium]|jgi:anti-sigma B factor antagonist
MGLVISSFEDVKIVTIEDVALLDPVAIDSIGRRLYQLVDDEAHRKIVVDFRKVRRLSSQMIGVVIEMHKKAQAIKGKVAYCGMIDSVRKGFHIARLDKVLHIADDETAAIRLVDGR